MENNYIIIIREVYCLWWYVYFPQSDFFIIHEIRKKI